jgi:hypothetical protein
MASGDTLFSFGPADFNSNPTSNYATLDTYAAATGIRTVMDFDGSAANEIAIAGNLNWPSHYDGGVVNVVVWYSTDGTSVGAVRFQVSFEVVQDNDDTDAGGQDFGTATNIDDTPATATANFINETAAGAISHVNCGSPSPGDACRFKIERDFDIATNTDDVQLLQVVITEQ